MTVNLEAFLARIYTDASARAKFLEDPAREACLAGLSETDKAAVVSIDKEGLVFASRSLARKRQKAGARLERADSILSRFSRLVLRFFRISA